MGSRFEDDKLIMEADGLSLTSAVKTLPDPPEADAMIFYFRAYFQNYSDVYDSLGEPWPELIDFTDAAWDGTIAFGFSYSGEIPYHDGSLIKGAGFFGWVDDSIYVNSRDDGAQYKSSEASINWGNPQDGDEITIDFSTPLGNLTENETYTYIYKTSSTGSLTTRTDDDNGIATVTSHEFELGNIITISWDGGSNTFTIN